MVAKSASFGHGSLVCGLWLAGGGRGGTVSTYVHGTFYIRFFVYQGYDISFGRGARSTTVGSIFNSRVLFGTCDMY